MQPELDKFDVNFVALSKDTVEQAATLKQRDNLQVKLLSDATLKVIQQYGVEHHKAIGFTTGKHALFRIPLIFMPSFKTMAIPTTILVDEHGVIQWIDQTDDYRLRSNSERVLAAVNEAFG